MVSSGSHCPSEVVWHLCSQSVSGMQFSARTFPVWPAKSRVLQRAGCHLAARIDNNIRKLKIPFQHPPSNTPPSNTSLHTHKFQEHWSFLSEKKAGKKRLHTYNFSSSRLPGWRDVAQLLAYVGQMKSAASSQRRSVLMMQSTTKQQRILVNR